MLKCICYQIHLFWVNDWPASKAFFREKKKKKATLETRKGKWSLITEERDRTFRRDWVGLKERKGLCKKSE